MTYVFTPPARRQVAAWGGLWSRFGTLVSYSVVRRGGEYQTVPIPSSDEVARLREGVDWFRGGHVYEVDDSTAHALRVAGFDVVELVVVEPLYPGGYPGQFPTAGPPQAFALYPSLHPGPNVFPTE